MAPPATKNCHVTRWTFSVVGAVIVALGGALLTVSWGTTIAEQRRVQKVNNRQDTSLVDVQLDVAVQGEQLNNIEKSIGELKKGQREILDRLPVQ